MTEYSFLKESIRIHNKGVHQFNNDTFLYPVQFHRYLGKATYNLGRQIDKKRNPRKLAKWTSEVEETLDHIEAFHDKYMITKARGIELDANNIYYWVEHNGLANDLRRVRDAMGELSAKLSYLMRSLSSQNIRGTMAKDVTGPYRETIDDIYSLVNKILKLAPHADTSVANRMIYHDRNPYGRVDNMRLDYR